MGKSLKLSQQIGFLSPDFRLDLSVYQCLIGAMGGACWHIYLFLSVSSSHSYALILSMLYGKRLPYAVYYHAFPILVNTLYKEFLKFRPVHIYRSVF